MQNFTLLHHALAEQELTILRDKTTTTAGFCAALERLATLVLAEATRDLPTESMPITTPLAPTIGKKLRQRIVLVPILRAGLGMLPAARHLFPEAPVGFVGMKRDESTAIAKQYYCNLPKQSEDDLYLILDPMLATGGSLSDAIDLLKEHGIQEIRALCILAATPGVDTVKERHPDIPVFAAGLDPALNEIKYILPGLGDAGDRVFGTTES